jgi:hypothetical protein
MMLTIAPSNFTFFELGMDLGLLSNYANTSYYSLFPYAHFNFFLPFASSGGQSKGGWYIGFGGGYMHSQYTFSGDTALNSYLSGDSAVFNFFTGNIVTGFNIADLVDISYSLRSDFTRVSGKLSIGMTRRFR